MAATPRYRKGVGAVLFNGDGLVFVGRRIDTAEPAWQLPQGGIKKHETPEQAVLRELAEEVGTARAEILAALPGWLVYDLPESLIGKVWGGKYCGQKQRWFALRFTGTDADIDLAASGKPEFEAWRWVPIGDLPRLAIAFKRALYGEIVAAFAHFAAPGARERPPHGPA
jgi:putative (di)nucleoside polyphosphate hydrolase